MSERDEVLAIDLQVVGGAARVMRAVSACLLHAGIAVMVYAVVVAVLTGLQDGWENSPGADAEVLVLVGGILIWSSLGVSVAALIEQWREGRS